MVTWPFMIGAFVLLSSIAGFAAADRQGTATDACAAVNEAAANASPHATYDEEALAAVGASNPGLANVLSILMVQIGTGQAMPLSITVETSALRRFVDNTAKLDTAIRSNAFEPVPNPGTRGRGVTLMVGTVELGHGQTFVRITPEDSADAAPFGGVHEVTFQRVAMDDGIRVKVAELRQ